MWHSCSTIPDWSDHSQQTHNIESSRHRTVDTSQCTAWGEQTVWNSESYEPAYENLEIIILDGRLPGIIMLPVNAGVSVHNSRTNPRAALELIRLAPIQGDWGRFYPYESKSFSISFSLLGSKINWTNLKKTNGTSCKQVANFNFDEHITLSETNKQSETLFATNSCCAF